MQIVTSVHVQINLHKMISIKQEKKRNLTLSFLAVFVHDHKEKGAFIPGEEVLRLSGIHFPVHP